LVIAAADIEAVPASTSPPCHFENYLA
jgi:hypothetical protein